MVRGFRASGSGIRVSGFGIRVPGSGIRVSDFRQGAHDLGGLILDARKLVHEHLLGGRVLRVRVRDRAVDRLARVPCVGWMDKTSVGRIRTSVGRLGRRLAG